MFMGETATAKAAAFSSVTPTMGSTMLAISSSVEVMTGMASFISWSRADSMAD